MNTHVHYTVHFCVYGRIEYVHFLLVVYSWCVTYCQMKKINVFINVNVKMNDNYLHVFQNIYICEIYMYINNKYKLYLLMSHQLCSGRQSRSLFSSDNCFHV